MKVIIMQDPEIYKHIGELTGRFNTLEKNIERQLDDIKETIKSQNSVPFEVFREYVADMKTTTKDFDERLEVVENKLNIRDASVTGKVASFLDNAIVRVVGTGAIVLFMAAVYVGYQKQVDVTNSRVDEFMRSHKIVIPKEQ